MMEPQHLSMLSSLQGEVKPEDYIQPHYKESYRLAIDSLVCGGQNSYQEFLKTERIGSFLSEEELLFITTHAERPSCGSHPEDTDVPSDSKSSTGTYWPTHSDVETPDLELGWPKATHMRQQTNIDLLFHPPRQNNPTIKEVIRKHMQDARQVIAIAMDIFTDVDIFKEAVDASIRGIPVYVLLDDYHLQSFLSMAENHDIHIQKLKNMRVRTVKGQDYLCRSGAKFHGAMEQKFLLVDCQTVVYGSYSFMWSFEKINLSMVQVITGQLVESYDEEFRTLYARSTVPTGLSPPEGMSDEGKPNGIRVLAKYVSQSGPYFERKDQLRHTLDTVYRKTCERQMAMKNIEERTYEDELLENRPIIDQGPGALKWMQQYQSAETKDFVKRHSYAGEREDVPYIPHNARYRASNWNVSGEGHLHYTNGRSNYPIATENYSQGQPMNQMYRGQHMRQSYHGNDKQVLSMQQKMPSLERTSKSFLRTWRLESYLNNSDTPVGDSSDYLDQYEDNKGSSFIPSRVRSSLVFNSTIPEQPETSSYQNNSSPSVHQNDFPAVPNNVPYYSPKQWEPTASNDHRLGNDEFQLKRRSLQMLDNPRSNIGFGPMRDSNHSVYASLGRAKGTDIKYSDNLQESWNKRHSVADPKSHTDYRDHREPSGQVYSAFVGRQVDRTSTRGNTQNGGFGLNLNEDQRSISHYDVKKVADTKTPVVSSWQEPPARTVSAAALDRNSRESTYKHHTSMSSPWFLRKSSKKIRSLLNIPEKKEASPHTRQSRSPELGSSTDTILAADEQQIRNFQGSTTNCISHQSEPSRIHLADDIGKASSPRFVTEELHQRSPSNTQLQNRTEPQESVAYKNDSSSLASGSWRRNRGPDSRLYSRFEPFCALEKKHRQSEAHTGNTLSQEKPKTSLVIKGNRTGELHNPLSQTTHGTHENKLGKFIQRVGHFIHKNK